MRQSMVFCTYEQLAELFGLPEGNEITGFIQSPENQASRRLLFQIRGPIGWETPEGTPAMCMGSPYCDPVEAIKDRLEELSK